MRYVIVKDDWRRFDRKYAVVDTARNDRPIFQTNDITRAIECRYWMNLTGASDAR